MDAASNWGGFKYMEGHRKLKIYEIQIMKNILSESVQVSPGSTCRISTSLLVFLKKSRERPQSWKVFMSYLPTFYIASSPLGHLPFHFSCSWGRDLEIGDLDPLHCLPIQGLRVSTCHFHTVIMQVYGFHTSLMLVEHEYNVRVDSLMTPGLSYPVPQIPKHYSSQIGKWFGRWLFSWVSPSCATSPPAKETIAQLVILIWISISICLGVQ